MSIEIGTDEEPQHFHDELGDSVGSRLNWLRAAVLGANDGIVSTAGVVMGVAGATDDSGAIVIAGIAALTAGALSMGAGEYVSVSTQRDSEKSILALEATELQKMPQTEERELAKMYVEKGLTPERTYPGKKKQGRDIDAKVWLRYKAACAGLDAYLSGRKFNW